MEININCVKDHTDAIAERVNEQFQIEKESIREKLLHEIKEYITPIPIHYKWEHDGCPYDDSGILEPNGTVNLNQTIAEFLENEYTGQKVATYISGSGFYYLNYGDELSYLTREIESDILERTTRKYLEELFDERIPDDVFEEIICDYHDDIYDNCLAFEFFSYEAAMEFVDIGNMKLSDLVEE